MALDREAVLGAIGTRLAALTPATLKTVTRRVLDWTQLPAQPAVVIVGEEQVAQTETAGLRIEWLFRVTLYVFAKADPGQTAAPDESINVALKAVEAAFEQPEGFVDTLSGICVRCAVTGTVSVGVASEDGGQYVAEVPLEVIVIA